MLQRLVDYDRKDSFVNRIRNARFRFFNEQLRAFGGRRISILDVGGFERFWINRGDLAHANVDITLLNLQAEETHAPNIRSVKGDACDMREFADGQFDIVFSNSVIEHLLTYEGQQAMAHEVQRVGRCHFIQTPNRHFVIEPHFLLPGFQFMPTAVQRAILTKTSLSRFKRISVAEADALLREIRLLTECEVATLFPRSRIYKEKLFGMTKSFTAYQMTE